MICKISWDKEIKCTECGICGGEIKPISIDMPMGKIEWIIDEIIDAGLIETEISKSDKIIIKLTEIKDIMGNPLADINTASEDIIDELGGEMEDTAEGIIIKI